MKKKIAVLFGGCSPEYGISISSAGAVISNIDGELYDVMPVGITREGNWFRYNGDIKKISSDEWQKDEENCVPVTLAAGRDIHGFLEVKDGIANAVRADAVFPVLHGKNGEDGSVQGILELAGIPVVGCGMSASALCMDKVRSKKLVGAIGVESAKFVSAGKNDARGEALNKAASLRYPVFVKPVKAGSSIGITKVYCASDLPDAVSNAYCHDDEVIIEENVEGFEIGCAVIGNEKLETGDVDEIELFVDWFDFHEKYSQKKSKIHTPGRLPCGTVKEAKEVSKAIYRALGCLGYARIDLFLTKDGKILFNEVNTIPGLTSLSRFPKMMRGAGYDFPGLISRLIELGVGRG